jgi:hypothetical protein
LTTDDADGESYSILCEMAFVARRAVNAIFAFLYNADTPQKA